LSRVDDLNGPEINAAEAARNPRSAAGSSAGSGSQTGDGLALHAAGEEVPQAAYLPPVSALDPVTTARLLPARYSDSVLTRIAETEADLQAVYALDNATNQRLLAEAGRLLDVSAGELLRHGRYARIVNAAFTHPHPLGARFSTPRRGAWYSAFELATAKAEVAFHRAVQLTEIGWQQPEALDYDHYSAQFSGLFRDLRPDLGPELGAAIEPDERGEHSREACLDSGSYIASQALAARLLRQGARGVVYPSARRPLGTCLACFEPQAVTHVRKHDLHRLTWRPDAPATFTRVARSG
jgi:hypothetical protein